MKILKPGRDQQGFSVEAKCTGEGNSGGGCGALLLVEQGDMRYYAGGGWCDRDPAVTFRCMACGVNTDLPTKSWPPNPSALKPWTSSFRDHGID